MHRTYLHNLAVLSDSALPLGSFAFSSGLESCLAHQPRQPKHQSAGVFNKFLELSVYSVANAALPFVLAAHSCPADLASLDNDLDAATACTVARRASVAQGRALLTMWDRSIKHNLQPESDAANAAFDALQRFSTSSKQAAFASEEAASFLRPADPNGHLAPLFGVLAAAMGIDLQDTLHLFLLNHVKTLLSAAIRASVFGPYQSQGLLVSKWLRDLVQSRVDAEIAQPTKVEDAGQTAPVLDIWSGRHDIVYSRIFNS